MSSQTSPKPVNSPPINTSLPPPPPPPPPPPTSSKPQLDPNLTTEVSNDLKAECAKVFKRVTLSDLKSMPKLDQAPRILHEDNVKDPKLKKNSICRVNLKKYFMRKVI